MLTLMTNLFDESYTNRVWNNLPSYLRQGIDNKQRGINDWQKYFLRTATAYHQIWPPLTYAEVKCHFTAEIVG